MSSDVVRLGVAAYPPGWLDSWDDYASKLSHWVESGVASGAGLLLFPEYASLELASLDGLAACADLEACLDAVEQRSEAVLRLHRQLAERHRITLVAASMPARLGGRWVNRAHVVSPDGLLGHQDKQIMTRFERESWNIDRGEPLQVIDTPAGRIGILICYDSEFPLLARALVEQGADLLLVPSCTDTLAGYWRVRIGSMARALENQCVVAQAVTVGRLDWLPALDCNVGAAAIYGPPDRGFPDDGLLALGHRGVAAWVTADVSLRAIATVRAEGQVYNHRHWPEQGWKPGRIGR